MPSLREMIRKLLFPYKSILSIAAISDERQNCTLLKEALYSAFVSADASLNPIVNLSYKKESDIFSFIVNGETEIRFSFHEKVVNFSLNENLYHAHDILIPVLRLNKYAAHEYDQTVHVTDALLGSMDCINKPVIFSYLNTEYLFEDKIENENQWQMMNNELYRYIVDNTVESKIKLTQQGNDIIRGLFEVFNYYSKGLRLFMTPQKVNFFANDNLGSRVVYGKSEFVTNLLVQLLSFDKLNSYHFKIN